MAQDGRRERLAPEPLSEIGVGRDLGPEQLDGDLVVHPDVRGAMDRSHPAATDDRAQTVAAAQQVLGGARGGGLARLGHARTIAQPRRTALRRRPARGPRRVARPGRLRASPATLIVEP